MSSRHQKTIVVLVLFAACLATQAWYASTWSSADAMAVWVFDVGQGDAIFIDAPEIQILIDGGGNDAVLEKLADVMPPWDRSIDVMIASHPHADHVLGLDAVLERYDVGEIVDNGLVYDSAAAVAFEQLGGTMATAAVRGMTWDLGHSARLDVVWPATSMAGLTAENVHEGNVVTLLTYGDTTVLLTGDAETKQEEEFMLGLPHIDVLKVGHHGSNTSTSYALVNLITPDYAVISVGEGNDYGHPSPLIVDRLLQAGAAVLRTDLDGDIRILTDGGEPRIAVFPNP